MTATDRYIFNVGDDLARLVKALADEYDVGIAAHVARITGDNEEVQKRGGVRSLRRYDDLGLFSPSVLLIHIGWVNEQEIEWLRACDVKVVHCPSASMHGAYGVISHGMFPEMIKAGVTVVLGNDSATAGRFLDMVKAMYLAACAHKDVTANRYWRSSAEKLCPIGDPTRLNLPGPAVLTAYATPGSIESERAQRA